MIMDSMNLSVIKITIVTDSLNSKAYLTGQAISKLQIPMTKTFQSLIGYLPVILSVLNFEFRSLIFDWDLYFGAWNFHDFHKLVTLFIPSNYLFK